VHALAGRLAWSPLLLRFKDPLADKAHSAHKHAFRKFYLGLVCYVLGVVQLVATANSLVRRDWVS
jgi:hypothetical protein